MYFYLTVIHNSNASYQKYTSVWILFAVMYIVFSSSRREERKVRRGRIKAHPARKIRRRLSEIAYNPRPTGEGKRLTLFVNARQFPSPSPRYGFALRNHYRRKLLLPKRMKKKQTNLVGNLFLPVVYLTSPEEAKNREKRQKGATNENCSRENLARPTIRRRALRVPPR